MKSNLYSVLALLIVLDIIIAVHATMCKGRSQKTVTWNAAIGASLSKWYEPYLGFTFESDFNNMVVLRELGLVLKSIEHKDAIQLHGLNRKYDESRIAEIYRYDFAVDNVS